MIVQPSRQRIPRLRACEKRGAQLESPWQCVGFFGVRRETGAVVPDGQLTRIFDGQARFRQVGEWGWVLGEKNIYLSLNNVGWYRFAAWDATRECVTGPFFFFRGSQMPRHQNVAGDDCHHHWKGQNLLDAD
jgi:hypothetical protein